MNRFENNVRVTPKSNYKQRNHSGRNDYMHRENSDFGRRMQNKGYERDNYGTPKRHSNRYEKVNEVKKTPQPATQYIYIPVQQPVVQHTQQEHPAFLLQQPGTHQMIPQTQPMYQSTQQEQQQPQ